MDFNEEKYKVVFTNDSIDEMEQIYNYISHNLNSLIAAKKLMKDIYNSIRNLKYMPRMYKIVKKYPELELEYREKVIHKYKILFSIIEKKKSVYIMHIYYCGRNNLNTIWINN